MSGEITLDLYETALRCIAYSNDNGITDTAILREFATAVLTRKPFAQCLLILIDGERPEVEPPVDLR